MKPQTGQKSGRPAGTGAPVAGGASGVFGVPLPGEKGLGFRAFKASDSRGF